jgi:hypothetical protein
MPPKAVGWKRIAAEMGVGVGTIYRVALEGSKIRKRFFEPSERIPRFLRPRPLFAFWPVLPLLPSRADLGLAAPSTLWYYYYATECQEKTSPLRLDAGFFSAFSPTV